MDARDNANNYCQNQVAALAEAAKKMEAQRAEEQKAAADDAAQLQEMLEDAKAQASRAADKQVGCHLMIRRQGQMVEVFCQNCPWMHPGRSARCDR